MAASGVVYLCGVFSFLVLVVYSGECCKVPPQFWCDSQEIAKECKVFDQCSEHVWHAPRTNAAPVALTLYYESLCPDCKFFFHTQLIPTFNKVASIMDLQLVPYGNAREKQEGDKWVFTCQHGEQECIGNLIETCALSVMKNISAAFPFIACMEESQKMPAESAPTCAKQYDIDLSPILACTQSSMGNTLEHQMAQLTDKLDPPHTYVPWITLNGVHTENIQDYATSHLLQLICNTYQGPKPAGCVMDKKSSRKHGIIMEDNML